MNVLIVYAHPEPKSFNGAMKDLAVETLTGAGHAVRVADLYALNVKAVVDADDVLQRHDPAFFNIQAETQLAWENGTLAGDIAQQQELVTWCDLLILQFPMWWWSMPAMLKGWFDRVFTTGFAYGGGKYFRRGGLAGRRAMLSMTTAAGAKHFQPHSLYGDIHERLYAIQHGMLAFVGFDVLEPFLALAVDAKDEEGRTALLEQYRAQLETIEDRPHIPFLTPDDYEKDGTAKPGRTRALHV